MPILVAWLLNGLRVLLFSQAGRIVVGALSFLGLQWASHKFAIGPAIAWFQSQMTTGPGGSFGAVGLQWLGVLQFDRAVSMLLSAWATRVSLDGARMVLSRVGT